MIVFYDHQVFELQQHGGISRYYFHLLQEFSRQQAVEPEIFFGVHRSELQNDFAGLARRRGLALRVPPVRRTHRLRRWVNRWLCERELQRSAAHIYHPTYHWTPGRRPTQPIALTVYDLIRERFPELYGHDDPEIAWRKHTLKHADVIFTISAATRDDLLHFYPVDPAKIVVTPLANTLQAVALAPAQRDRPYLLFVGQRDGYKNFAIILEAYRRSPGLARDLDLVCFGGEPALPGDLPPGIRLHQVRGNDSVLAGLYRDAFALVYPSRLEGFGLPLLEAMSLGCPVIATRCGSLPEVGGDAPLYFGPDDATELLDCIEQLKSPSRRETICRLGRDREKQYSWQRTAEGTLAGYRRIAG